MYLGSVHLPEQTFWVLCYGFYLLDNIRATEPGTFFVSGSLGGGWRLIIPAYRFELRDRAYALLNLATPWTATFPLDWPSRGMHDTTGRTLRALALRQAAVFDLRIVSSCCFAAYFILAPSLTALIGLPATLGPLLMLHFAGTAATAFALIRPKRQLRASWPRIAKLVFECGLCPGVQANAFRRTCLDFRPMPGDALQLALTSCADGKADDLARNLQGYFDSLAEREKLTHEAAQAGATCIAELRAKAGGSAPQAISGEVR